MVRQVVQERVSDKVGTCCCYAGLFLVTFFELWGVPRKGMRWGGEAEVKKAGGKIDVCDGKDVERLGATVYLSRQMLIWSNSRIARVGALVVDSSVVYGGTTALSIVWGLTAATWVYIVVKFGSAPGGVSDVQCCTNHVFVETVQEYLEPGLNSMYEYVTGNTDHAGVSAAARSSFMAGVSGFIIGMISFPDIIVVFTPAVTGNEAFTSLVGSLVYVCASCVIGALAGAPVGLVAVTSVVFPVFLVSLVWGNFALRFVPADDDALNRFQAADEWNELFKRVLMRGIGQKVLGISDQGLVSGLHIVEADRVVAMDDELRSLVASLVRSDTTRTEYCLVEKMTPRSAVELMRGGEPLPLDPAGLKRMGHDIVPKSKQGDEEFDLGGVTCRLVKVTNSTSPMGGRNYGVKPILYEEDEIIDGKPPALSLVAVQRFRRRRYRVKRGAGPGYCQSVGPPPLTVEEGLVIIFVSLLVCWLLL